MEVLKVKEDSLVKDVVLDKEINIGDRIIELFTIATPNSIDGLCNSNVFGGAGCVN